MTVLLGIALLAYAAWLYLVFFRDGFWRGDQRLPAEPPALAAWPGVVAVIPARDEAATIGDVVASHQASDYPGDFTLVIVDDHSSDGTAEIARTAGNGGSRRLDVIPAPELRAAWTGKLNAVDAGLAHAAEIAPEARYVLLTDADISYAPETLRRLVAHAETHDYALVSLMALLDARGAWARLLVPAFVFFFQKLYPFAAANDPARRLAAAAGGVMLVERAALDDVGGVAAIKSALIDDCALARLIKGGPPARRTWLGLTRHATSLRDNRPLSSVWNMVARTAYAQLNHSPALLVGTVLAMALIYLAAPVLVLTAPWHGQAAAAIAGAGAWTLMAFAYAPTAALYREPLWVGVFLPVSAALYTLMTISSALRHWRGDGGLWKGRSYSQD